MEFYDFPYIGNNDPNWRTPWFFRGVGLKTPNSNRFNRFKFRWWWWCKIIEIQGPWRVRKNYTLLHSLLDCGASKFFDDHGIIGGLLRSDQPRSRSRLWSDFEILWIWVGPKVEYPISSYFLIVHHISSSFIIVHYISSYFIICHPFKE